MINGADHHDLSVVCQAQTYQIVGQQKSGPLEPVGGAEGGEGTPITPPTPYWPENGGEVVLFKSMPNNNNCQFQGISMDTYIMFVAVEETCVLPSFGNSQFEYFLTVSIKLFSNKGLTG